MSKRLPSTISEFTQEQDLLKELLPVAVQLYLNDMNTSGINAVFPEINDLFSFRDVVKEKLERSGGITSEKIMQLLYRIDVPQVKMFSSLTKNDPLTAVAEAIVIRELQKAWTRKYFS